MQSAVEARQIAAEARRVAAEARRIATEARRITVEACPIATEACRITVEARQVAAEARRIAVEARQIATEACPIAAEAWQISTEARRITVEARPIGTEGDHGLDFTPRSGQKSGRRGAMTPEQRQEEISKAYLHAVAAKCGFAVGTWSQDHGCLDVTIGADATVGTGHLVGPKVDVQLKATTRQDVEHDSFISWTLDIDHYEKLIARAFVPRILVVLLLPRDVEQSVEHTVDHLLVRRCAYWVRMTGMPPAEPGQKTKTVRLPKAQVFSPDQLTAILEKISKGELP